MQTRRQFLKMLGKVAVGTAVATAVPAPVKALATKYLKASDELIIRGRTDMGISFLSAESSGKIMFGGSRDIDKEFVRQFERHVMEMYKKRGSILKGVRYAS